MTKGHTSTFKKIAATAGLAIGLALAATQAFAVQTII